MSQRTAGNPPKKPRPGTRAAEATGADTTAASSSSSPLVASFLTPLFIAKLVGWSVGWYLAARLQFGSIYMICTAIYLIFTNLSGGGGSGEGGADGKAKSAGGISAYSVFNVGAQRIAGSMDAESFENELRHAPKQKKPAIDLDIGDTVKKEHPERKSKAANQPCVCGSGRKVSPATSEGTTDGDADDGGEAHERIAKGRWSRQRTHV